MRSEKVSGRSSGHRRRKPNEQKRNCLTQPTAPGATRNAQQLLGKSAGFAIDLRKSSKTYHQWVGVELSPQNRKQMYIPAWFGHAFLSLEDDTHLVVRIDSYFDPELERAISYKDDEIKLNIDIANPILSMQDAEAPFPGDSDCNLSMNELPMLGSGRCQCRGCKPLFPHK